jgi:transcription elongation GreA/GreB family factor
MLGLNKGQRATLAIPGGAKEIEVLEVEVLPLVAAAQA